MSAGTFCNIKISGLASAVPKRVNKIRDLADKFEVEKFIETTGVEERRFAHKKQTCSDLCYEAAEKLIAHKGYDKKSFDGIILVTQSPDYGIPATSHVLHMRLGLSKDCMAFDINLGCSGFVYGISIVAGLIQSGSLNRVLLCCGDVHGCLSPEDDPGSSMLFGDAGCVAIMEKTTPEEEQPDPILTLLKADGSGYQAIISLGLHKRGEPDLKQLDYDKICTHMDGPAVFAFGISSVPRVFKEFFGLFGGGINDYDYCVFHQANLFMLEHIQKKLKLPKEKMPVSMDRFGNTSSASIPLTITDLCQRENVKDKIKFITCGFGVGLSWGIATFSMNKEDILPLIETDEYFREAYRG